MRAARAFAQNGPAPGARSALWTVANRSAGPPTRIVVNRASGSSREVLTPIRRWMSVPMRDGVEGGDHGPAAVIGCHPGQPFDRRRVGQRRAVRGRHARARRRRRPLRAGRATGRRRPSRRARVGSSRSVAASSSAAASNASSSTMRAAPASTSAAALARWCPEACGYGTTTIGRPSAVTSASVEAPARPTTRSAVASAASISSRRNAYGRYRARSGAAEPRGPRARRDSLLAGHVDDRHPFDETRQRLGNRGVEPADGLRPAEDQKDAFPGRDVHPDAGRPRGRCRRWRGSACR